MYAFSGWVEAFFTNEEKVHRLLKKIIPRFGIPIIKESGNGLMFGVAQLVAKGLKITWTPHTVPELWEDGMNETAAEQKTMRGNLPVLGPAIAYYFVEY